MQHLRPDKCYKGHKTKYYTEDVDDVVSVTEHLACAATGETARLIRLDGAGERLGHKRTCEYRGVGLARMAGRRGEGVDQAQDEVAWECTAKVTYARRDVSTTARDENGKQPETARTYVARRVM